MTVPAMQAIANISLDTAVSSVSFSNVPQNYRDLRIVIVTQQNVTSTKQASVQFNGDVAANYSLVYADANPPTNYSGTDTKIAFSYAYAGTSTNEPFLSVLDIIDYSASDKNKATLTRGGSTTSISMYAGRWASNDAITSILISSFTGGNFSAGSTFTLYGVLA